MFTGKTPNFRLEENFMPLGLMILGIFMRKRHPGLAMLLMALGGGTMMKNASHAIYTPEQKESLKNKHYKVYDDEQLNSRIKNPMVKGRQLFATIDGNPLCVTIHTDSVLAAYEQGAIPLNVLANRCLEKIDSMQQHTSQSYERQVAAEKERQQGYQLR